MGSLANQYISQSYTSLIHLGSDTTASANLVQLQDGLGNGLGISVNTQGDISASNSVTTLNLNVMSDTELSGAFSLNTYFTASTIPYFNSTQPFFNDTVYVTGSYPTNNYPPSIADVEVGWLGNGINVTNGVVTAVSKSVSGYYITMAGQFPQSSQYYTFTGRTSPTARIYGALEISENLVVSGTFDIEGKVVVNDNVVVNGTLSVSSSTSITGALDVRETLTASAALIENDLIVSGTLFASKVVTLIESSSVIYSSGSNILGDEVSDTQTLIGATIMSGSATLSGSMSITNNLSVTNNISSSTISGIGNVTLYSTSVDSRLVYIETTFSTSVDSRLDFLEGPFSTSVDARLDLVEATASYLNTTFSTSVDSRLDYIETTFSTSVDSRLDYIETTFSTSVDSRLDYLETTFSTSVDTRLDELEFSSSYINTTFSTSVDLRLDNLEAWSSSLQIDFATQAELNAATASLINQIDTKLNTSSFNAYTQSYSSSVASQFSASAASVTALSSSVASTILNLSTSVDSRLDLVESSVTTLNSYTSSNNSRWSVLDAKTGSYATTGSNVFIGNQTITGSLILSSSAAVELTTIGNSVFSGSVTGRVVPITIASSTASMDCSLGNFFTLTLGSATNTRLIPTNIQPGETISLRITQPATTGSLTYPSSIKFPATLGYSASIYANAVDILTFVSFDSTNLFSVAVKNMQ